MAETFYPFVDNGGGPDDDIAPPTTSARIAVYDDMSMVPRVVSIEPTDIRTYLEEITKTVFELATQQGGDWSFMLIRELVENFIHASFIEPSISILDKGQTIVFSDQGPGIPNKQAALKPSFSSATTSMKRYIRGVGSGLPIVEEQLRLKHGSITIEDNLGHGTIVTVSLAPSSSSTSNAATSAPDSAVPQAPQTQPAGYAYPQGYPRQAAYPPQPYGAAPGYPQPQQAGYPYPAQQPTPTGYPQQPCGAANPYAQPYANPYGASPGAAAPSCAQQPCGAAYPYGMAVQQPQPQGYGYPVTTTYGMQPLPGQPYGTQQPAAPCGANAPAPRIPAGTPGQAAIDAHTPLTSQQRQIVRLFGRYGELGPTELSNELGFSESTGTRRLKDIMAAGYVTKSGQKYILTGEGERMLAYLMDSEV